MNHSLPVYSRICRYWLVLLTPVAIACSSPPETEKKAPIGIPVPQLLSESSTDLAGFTGKWENVDSETDHLTRVEILQPDSTAELLVRIWASCDPECFWGDNTSAKVVLTPDSNMSPHLFLEWDLESSVPSQRISLLEEGLLQIDTHTKLREVDIEFDEIDRFRRAGEASI